MPWGAVSPVRSGISTTPVTGFTSATSPKLPSEMIGVLELSPVRCTAYTSLVAVSETYSVPALAFGKMQHLGLDAAKGLIIFGLALKLKPER